MIIVMRPDHHDEDLERIVRRLEDMGLKTHISKGEQRTIVGAIGDERVLAEIPVESFPGVEKTLPILKPYKLVSREFKPDNTVVSIDGLEFGGPQIQIVAGRWRSRAGKSWRKSPKLSNRRACIFCGAARSGRAPHLMRSRVGRKGVEVSCKRARENRDEDCNRTDGPRRHRAGLQVRGHHPDRHPQHAEFQAAHRGRQYR